VPKSLQLLSALTTEANILPIAMNLESWAVEAAKATSFDLKTGFRQLCEFVD